MDDAGALASGQRIRVGILWGTIIATTLAYSTALSSFLHAKYLALSVGIALLGLATVITGKRITRESRVLSVGWTYLFLTCFVMAVVGSRESGSHFSGDQLRIVTILFLLPLFAVIAYDVFSEERSRHAVSLSIGLSALCAAALGIGQYAGVLAYLFPAYPASSPIYSVFGNSGLLGGYIALAFPLVLAIYLQAKLPAFLAIPALAILACALLLSGARTAWLACVLGCAVTVLQYPRVKSTAAVAIAMIAVASLCVWVAPQQTVSRAAMTLSPTDAGANLRWWFWSGTWDMICDYPIIGVTLGRFAEHSPLYLANVLWEPGGERFAHNTLFTEHPHNDYLLLLAETGIVGLALCLWAAHPLIRCKGPEWGAIAGLAVFALFNSPLSSPPHALAGTILLLMLARRSTGREKVTGNSRWATVLLALLAPLAFLWITWETLIAPSYQLQQAQSAHVEGRPCLELYGRASKRAGLLRAEIGEKYGVALLDAGRYEEAKEQFTIALNDGDSGSLYLGLGTAEYLIGNRSAAMGALEKAVYRWPSHVDAWQLLLRVCPEKDRGSWLKRAERFLRTGEIKVLRSGQR